MSTQQTNPQSTSQQTSPSTSQKAGSKEEQRSRDTALTRQGGGSPALRALWDPFNVFFLNPFSMIRSVQDEINQVFARAGSGNVSGRGEDLATWIPPVEVTQRDGNLEISAELPGLSEKDVKVEIDNDVLVIQGERKVEEEKTQGGIHKTERRYGKFYRALALPEGADAEKARAEFKDGVLHVSIPVPSNVRQIPVQTASEQGAEQSGARTDKAA